jgi:hypothetical protein
MHALSLKQPWATLLVHGRKTIEIRSWPTSRRERILIHAALIADDRPEAWAKVPRELLEMTTRKGGFIGVADLTGCVTYANVEAFTVDQARHLNDPEWFKGTKLFGFTFANAAVVPFRPYSGWMRFFPVEDEGSK